MIDMSNYEYVWMSRVLADDHYKRMFRVKVGLAR